jgi:hypothetical protein
MDGKEAEPSVDPARCGEAFGEDGLILSDYFRLS